MDGAEKEKDREGSASSSSTTPRKNKRYTKTARDRQSRDEANNSTNNPGSDSSSSNGTEVARKAESATVSNDGSRKVVFDLEESSTSNEENTEAEEEIGPLISARPSLSAQSSFDGLISDPAAHTPKMRHTMSGIS
ncbi:lisH domain-containing protein C1711.05, partial [Aplysia californica]